MLEGKISKILNLESYIERYTEIERENRILLEKMTHIMQTTNTTSNLVASASNNRGTLYTASAILPTANSI